MTDWFVRVGLPRHFVLAKRTIRPELLLNNTKAVAWQTTA